MSDIDLRDFGRLEADVEALQNQVTRLTEKVDALLELANQSKGGFWAGMTIASIIGGAATFVAERLIK
jgi:hypothetical protein